MALSVAVAAPLVVGLVLVLAGAALRRDWVTRLTLGAALVSAGAAVYAVATHDRLDVAWLPSLAVRLVLRSDGLSAPLVLLTAGVGVLVAVYGMRRIPAGGPPGTFCGLLLVVLGGALATFLAGDALLFFVAFETVLIPMWVIIGRYGDNHDPQARRAAASRFALFTLAGSSLMLVGILLLVVRAGTSDLAALPKAAADLPLSTQTVIAVLLTLGLAVKVPVWPLHAWLPPAHTIAPTAGSVLLAAILLKMGTYGLLRLPALTVTDGFSVLAPALAVLGVVGIIWGGLVCLVERDLKRLIAYSSVAHMGFVVLALATGSEVGLRAAAYGNVAHGVISAMLFFVVGGLKDRWGTVDLASVRPALRETWPRMGFALVLGLAAGLGLPGLAGFWGEFLAMYAAWTQSDPADHPLLWRWLAGLAAVGAALAAAYALRVLRRVWVGDAVAPADRVTRGDADAAETVVLVALGCAVVLLGVLPGPLLSVTGAALRALGGGS